MKVNIIKLNEEIDYIRVFNEKNIDIEFCNFGAGIRYFRYKGENLVLVASREEFPYLPCYYGKTLGRVAGRIACRGVLDGKEYNLFESTHGYSLHGGDIRSQSYQPWKYEIKEKPNKIQLIFTKKSKNGEMGFPGALTMKVIYEITEKDELKITYKGTTPTSTLLNMSNHNYYNFMNSHDISNYKLKINASKVATIDDYIFITGLGEVDKTNDFRKFAKIGSKNKYFEKQSVGTIDFTYVFDSVSKSKPQMILQSKDLRLSLYTDYPSANVYVDNGMKEIKFEQYNDKTPVMRRAVALEPQLFDFDKESLILRRGEKYNHFIKLKLKDLRK